MEEEIEGKKAIKETVTDKLSLKLWNWLLGFTDMKSFYKRDHTYNNDFARFPTPEGYVFAEAAHNDWRKSSWKLELEKMYFERPELLLPGEKEMIDNWLHLEHLGFELPTTYDETFEKVAKVAIKKTDYYEKN